MLEQKPKSKNSRLYNFISNKEKSLENKQLLRALRMRFLKIERQNNHQIYKYLILKNHWIYFTRTSYTYFNDKLVYNRGKKKRKKEKEMYWSNDKNSKFFPVNKLISISAT